MTEKINKHQGIFCAKAIAYFEANNLNLNSSKEIIDEFLNRHKWKCVSSLAGSKLNIITKLAENNAFEIVLKINSKPFVDMSDLLLDNELIFIIPAWHKSCNKVVSYKILTCSLALNRVSHTVETTEVTPENETDFLIFSGFTKYLHPIVEIPNELRDANGMFNFEKL